MNSFVNYTQIKTITQNLAIFDSIKFNIIMQLIKATQGNIIKAAEVIVSGGLVAFPTETVYGLGADGLNPIAVAKIFEVKQRPSFNPLILHIAKIEQLEKVAKINNPSISKLIEKFWPGPLTLVLPKLDIVPDIVTAGNPTVAVRMPDHPVALELIDKAGVPIAAPSANVFSQLSPTCAEHVVKQLNNKVDVILDGGSCPVGVESTILYVKENEVSVLRHGGLAIEDIEKIIGKVDFETAPNGSPIAPGQLYFHYAPHIPLRFFNEVNIMDYEFKKVGALLFNSNRYNIEFSQERILSTKGNMREAAANLFSYLHELENEDLDVILVDPIEENGLGKAIMDRLRKAANKFV